MNQLFTIMRRWLLHDKKRTLLTLASITLSVFLISFVGVYMSSALGIFRGSVEYMSPYHASFSPEDLEQVSQLDRNASWESHAVKISADHFLTEKALIEAIDNGANSFPDVEINGCSVFESGFVYMSAELRGGDPELFGRYDTNGQTFTVEPHEVVVSRGVASAFGLEKGGSFQIKCMLRDGKLYYATADENASFSSVGDDDTEEINEEYDFDTDYDEDEYYSSPRRDLSIYKKDADGNILYTEDSDGSELAVLYGKLDTVSEWQSLRLLSDIYSRELETANYTYSGLNGGQPVPPMYAEFTGESQVLFEYNAVVRDIVETSYSSTVYFSADDKDILPYIEDSMSIEYSVKVKEGIDAKDAVINAMKGIGIYDEQTENYELNIDLLLTEGRQLEYIESLVLFFVLFVIVMGLFMFLARLIINNAFEISAAYRTEQYGALKTIGASDKQIFLMVMIESAIYMVIALPAGMGLALLAGRMLLSKLRDIAVFDPVYGEGVSDMFFRLEFSPMVMWLSFGCALFSVFFSAYADAMRVKRMPPIMSIGYGSGRSRISGRSPWLSRRLFGYPFGFAVKCISRQKVRFAVTLLASVISGIFIMMMGCIAKYYSASLEASNNFTDRRADIVIENYTKNAQNADIAALAGEMYRSATDSGLFEEVVPNCTVVLRNNGSPSVDAVLTDEYLQFCDEQQSDGNFSNQLCIIRIPRENYDRYITADMSYDEFAASGKALLCRNTYEYCEYDNKLSVGKNGVVKVYRDRYNGFEGIKDTEILNTSDIGTLEITGEYYKSDGQVYSITEKVPFAGVYSTDCPDYMTMQGELAAIIPFESDPDLFISENNKAYLNFIRLDLYAKDDCKAQAAAFAESMAETENEKGCQLYIQSYIEQDASDQKGITAVRLAGTGFAAALGAVVLLNIFSTMSANMINRRRELSMMRSCGMSLKQVAASLVIESGFYAVITALVSSLAGWVLSVYLISLVGDSQQDFFTQLSGSVLPIKGALELFAVVMLVMAAAYVPALMTISRSNIAEEIRTKL